MTVGFAPQLLLKQTGIVLPESCFILTRTEEPNGAGGRKVSYMKGEEATPCAIAPLGGGEYTGSRALKPAGDRLDDRTTNVITLPPETSVTEKDKVEVIGRGVFEITALRRRSIEILREVEVREAP